MARTYELTYILAARVHTDARKIMTRDRNTADKSVLPIPSRCVPLKGQVFFVPGHAVSYFTGNG